MCMLLCVLVLVLLFVFVFVYLWCVWFVCLCGGVFMFVCQCEQIVYEHNMHMHSFSKGPSIWKDMIDFYVQVRPVMCKINRAAKHR